MNNLTEETHAFACGTCARKGYENIGFVKYHCNCGRQASYAIPLDRKSDVSDFFGVICKFDGDEVAAKTNKCFLVDSTRTRRGATVKIATKTRKGGNIEVVKVNIMLLSNFRVLWFPNHIREFSDGIRPSFCWSEVAAEKRVKFYEKWLSRLTGQST